ncbi:MAG: winged helix-turn-helix domain-containing protein [Pseudomonadota bacterium]
MAAMEPRIDILGNALAHGARAQMVCAMMDGRSWTARELAEIAGVTPQTATHHLGRLIESGIVSRVAAGRHAYHRITSAEMAEALETIAGMAPQPTPRRSAAPSILHEARCCYDHLAGRLGVALCDRLLTLGALRQIDAVFEFGAEAEPVFAALDLDLHALPRRRHKVKACLDWTERRMHMGGAVGAVLLERSLDRGWLKRGEAPRHLVLTGAGRRHFRTAIGLDVAAP